MLWTFPASACLITSLAVILFSVLMVMFERKFIAIAQKRLGSSFLGRNGWAHVPADLLKFWLKQSNRHQGSWGAAQNSAIGALLVYYSWSLGSAVFFLPDGAGACVDFWDYQLLCYFGYANLSTLFMYHVAMGQRSKYSMVAAGRLLLMSVFMEVFFALCFTALYFHTGGYGLEEVCGAQEVSGWLAITLPVLASMFFLYCVFEAKRAPFDHTEAESELVAGHQIEFGGRALLFLLLCEYIHVFFCFFLILTLLLGAGSFFFAATLLPYWADLAYAMAVC